MMIYLVLILAVALVASCAWNYSLRNKLQAKTSKNLELEQKLKKSESVNSNVSISLVAVTHILNEPGALVELGRYLSEKDYSAETGSMSSAGEQAWNEVVPVLKNFFKYLFIEGFYQLPADTSLQVLIASFPTRWLDVPDFFKNRPEIKERCLAILYKELKVVKSYSELKSLVSLYQSWAPFAEWKHEIDVVMQLKALELSKQEIMEIQKRVNINTGQAGAGGNKFEEVAQDLQQLFTTFKRSLVFEDELQRLRVSYLPCVESALRYLKPAVNNDGQVAILSKIIKEHNELYTAQQNQQSSAGSK